VTYVVVVLVAQEPVEHGGSGAPLPENPVRAFSDMLFVIELSWVNSADLSNINSLE
jgi:hypothetical protein